MTMTRAAYPPIGLRKMLIVLLVVFAACGNGEEATNEEAGPQAPTPAAAACGKDEAMDVPGKPKVEIPDEPPPQQLKVEDLKVGTGAEVKPGDTATVHYVGVCYSTKKEFDASWDRGQPFPVENVGQAPVIKGWNQGLIGMKVGGQRKLTIPPDLAYGPQGRPGIGPNATLVFVIDLVSIP